MHCTPQPELESGSAVDGRLFDGAVAHVSDALLNTVVAELLEEIAMDECFEQLSPMSESSIEQSPTHESSTPAEEHIPEPSSSSSPGGGTVDSLLVMAHSAMAAPCAPPAVLPCVAPSIPLVYHTPPQAGSRHRRLDE